MQALTCGLLLLSLAASSAAADTLFRSTTTDQTFAARAYPIDAPDRNIFYFYRAIHRQQHDCWLLAQPRPADFPWRWHAAQLVCRQYWTL